ncbi:MAG: PRK06851 family protein [Clostridia bacterium]|nr:PRK06851 family protein [Clostridia bacterium]
MSEGKVKHLFPGGNTSLGFFSYYSNIITQEEADRFIIIKGGPGVGKSTFMKRIGEEMLKKGYDVEFLHCSSDNNSLDGVKIPGLKIAIIDGTAPHVVDPKSPGAVDEILNFGEFWNEDGIRIHKENIIKVSKEIGSTFNRAYKYLKAAYAVYEDNAVINGEALNKGEVNLLASSLIEELFNGRGISKEEGKQRSLFVSAITPRGFCNYIDTILTSSKVYEIKGGMGTGEEKILEKVKGAAVERGLNIEAYYCALNPYKLEHLVIPELDTAFTTTNTYHSSSANKLVSIDMLQYLDQKILECHKDDLQQNSIEVDNLLSVALSTISRAKALHDELETYYVPNINFEAINKCFEKTMDRILKD